MKGNVIKKDIVGIDPGEKGAFWCLSRTGSTGRWMDMPFRPNREGIDDEKIYSFLKNFDSQSTIVALEKPFYSQLLRGKAGFTFGLYYGIVKGIVIGMGFDLRDVRPLVWKKHFALVTKMGNRKTKDHSIQKACSLNPLFRTKFTVKRTMVYRQGEKAGKKYIQTVKKDGRAEAYLIAEYARRCLI